MSDKLTKLESNPELAQKLEVQKSVLNSKPRPEWVKQHPFARNVSYIPIGQIENLLDIIFQKWKVEVKGVQQLFNSVSVEVRLHYFNPVTSEWDFHDGVGAVGIQTNKGAAASDLTAVKQDAVMKALPAAKSYAIKDACEHLGDLFGRNLNRVDNPTFNRIRFSSEEMKDKIESNFEAVRDKLTPEDVQAIEQVIIEENEKEYKRIINVLNKVK